MTQLIVTQTQWIYQAKSASVATYLGDNQRQVQECDAPCEQWQRLNLETAT